MERGTGSGVSLGNSCHREKEKRMQEQESKESTS